MTLRQTVQAAPGKTSDLIAKLSETSNQAVKTREDLFANLSSELTRYIEIEEKHFLPLLRKYDDTIALVPDALKGNKDLRASLEKLTVMPKDTDEFLAGIDELKKSFQQHIRDERKELLPAVLKALTDEEASDLAANIDTAVAEAQKVKRDEKREEAAKAKRDEEKAEADAKAKRDAVKAEREAIEAEKVAAEKREAAKAKRAFDKAEQAKAAKRAAAQAQKTAKRAQLAASDTQASKAVNDTTAVKFGEASQAVEDSSMVFVSAAKDVYAVWMEYVSSALRINTAASLRLTQCKSIGDVADLQTEFATSALRNMMDGNEKVFEIARGASKKAKGPTGTRPD